MKFLTATLLTLTGVSARFCPPRSNYPTFTGNISADVLDLAYSYRASSSFTLSIPGSGGMGAYSSVAAFQNPLTAEFDAFAARLAVDIFHPPTATSAWFSSSASLVVNASDSGINGGVYAGAFTSAMASVFLNVIEFQDLNGDGIYDPVNDATVQTVKLQNQRWDTMCSSSSSSSSDGLVSFNISTVPSLLSVVPSYSIQSTLSQVAGVIDAAVALTPRSMKIDFAITNFPYIGYTKNGVTTQTTKLALSAVVASAQAGASASVNYDGRRIQAGDGDSQFTLDWETQARAGPGSVNVKSSGFADFANTDGSLGLALDLFFAASISAGGKVSLKKIYFSFDATQPSSVYWDPTIISGTVPPSIDSSDASNLSDGQIAGITIGVILGVALLAALLLAVIRYYRSTPTSKAETETLVSDNGSSRSPYGRVNEM